MQQPPTDYRLVEYGFQLQREVKALKPGCQLLFEAVYVFKIGRKKQRAGANPPSVGCDCADVFELWAAPRRHVQTQIDLIELQHRICGSKGAIAIDVGKAEVAVAGSQIDAV